MTIKKYSVRIGLALSVLFTSCLSSDADIDTTKPVIHIVEPVTGTRVEAGESIHLEMELSDNVALGSYDIDIHSAEGHSHTSGDEDHNHGDDHDEDHDHDHDHEVEDPENEGRKPFKYKNSWEDIYSLPSASIHHHEIQIPLEAKRGEYHFVIKVLDRAGNQAMDYRTIRIVNPGEGDTDHNHEH